MQAKLVLPIIVFSQFCCTSLWFAGNAVMSDLLQTYDLNPASLGHLTSAVQFGFITGTLIFAFLSVADRFSPSKVFFVCAVLGALFNLGIILFDNNLQSLLLLRFGTGFFLAGIYPVGMKIASDYFEKGLGTSLGFLVGALVLGTAFPHFLKSFFQTENFPWRNVILVTSGLAVVGGFLVLLVPNGPFRSRMLKKNFSAFLDVFRNADFRSAAFGYFGHMWELYAFWAFVPVILVAYEEIHSPLNISLISFLVIGSGGIACMVAGFVSEKLGTRRTASTALFLSGSCCLCRRLFSSRTHRCCW